MKIKPVNFCLLIAITLFGCTGKGQQPQVPPTKVPNKIVLGNTTINLRKNLRLKVSDSLTPYFFSSEDDFKGVLKAPTDENGVVMHDDEYKPTYIFQCGMNAYRYFKKNNDQVAKKYFEDQVAWLKANFQEIDGKYGFWYFTHEKSFYSLDELWPSALSQGMGIGLALMAYHETQDPQLLEIIEKAFKGYAIPVDQGGFYREWDGGVWFEEYPTSSPSRVMNGFIFSIAGLYNLYANTGNELALSLFNEGVSVLKEKLPLYDAEFVSKYSLIEKEGFAGYAKKSYHKLHVWQLLWLYDVTDDTYFHEMAQKFLEIQKTNFNLQNFRIRRVKEVSANNSLGKNIPEHVYDNEWSWGGVWASYKKPELKFALYEPREVRGLSFYFNSEKSQELPFSIFVKNGTNTHKASNVELIKRVVHRSNKKRAVYINVYHFDKAKGDSVMIRFEGTDRHNPVSITEADVFVVLDDEIDRIHQDIQRRRQNDQNFPIGS